MGRGRRSVELISAGTQVTPFLLAASVGRIFVSYTIFRPGHYPMIQRSLAALRDLESQLAERTERICAQRKYWVIGAVLLVIALTFTLVWDIKVRLSATP